MEDKKENGRYFYLMLKENFYDSDDMVLLESMENGYLYSNILLKLYLKSLKDKGKLMYKDRIPYNAEMLAKLTRHNIDVVRRAVDIFQQMGIIEILDNGAIFMLDIQNYIGKSSTEADRRRKYDRRIAEEKQKLIGKKSPCEKSCEKSHEHINTNTDTELELDTDLITNNNNIYDYIATNFGITISGFIYEKIQSWLLLFDENMLKHAVDICVERSKRNLSYFYGILENWKGCNFKTLQDVIEDEDKRKKIKTVENKTSESSKCLDDSVKTEKISEQEEKEMLDMLKKYN